MKKLFLLALTVVMSMMLFACDKETTTVAGTETPVTTTAAAAETTTVAAVETTVDTTAAATTTETVYQLADMYEGSHDVSAMGSAVTYCYTMTFDDGSFTFHSAFEMGGETYTYNETGTYTVAGNDVTLTPSVGDAFTGTIGDGVLTVGVQASSMASRAEQTLTKVEVGRIYVGSHTVSAMGTPVVYAYIMKLAYGTYTFHSSFVMGGETYTYDESGTYSVAGTALTLTPEGEDAVTGIIGDGTLAVSVKASSMASRAEQTLTESELAICYEGTHTVTAMGSDVVYVYTIEFVLGAYTFHSDYAMAGTDYTYDETGTYTVADGVITMTPEGETAVTGSIGLDGTLELPIKASSMATRAAHTFTECVVVVASEE